MCASTRGSLKMADEVRNGEVHVIFEIRGTYNFVGSETGMLNVQEPRLNM